MKKEIFGILILSLAIIPLSSATILSDLNLTVPSIFANSYNFTEDSELLSFDGQTISFNWTLLNESLDSRYSGASYTNLSQFTNDLNIGNWTLDKPDYFTKSNILAFNYYNSTDFVITDYFTKSQVLNLNYFNTTNFPFTSLSNFTNDLGFLNTTTADPIYLNIDGDTMNGNIDLANNNLTGLWVQTFNTSLCNSPENLPAGSLCWNPDEDTLNIVTSIGQVIQVGRELGEQGINKEGSTIMDGSVVYLSGATGDNPEFKKADGTNISESSMVGVLTTECINNQLCPITVFGFVNNLNTSMWSLGDKLYIDPSNAGELINTKPTLPNNPTWIATVVRVSETAGRILVNPHIDMGDGLLINDIYATNNIFAVNNITATWFNGKFNWTTDDWNSFNGYNLTFNESKLSTIYYNASAIEVVTGTPSGSISDIQQYNQASYNITEQAVANGLDFRVNFTGIEDFNSLVLRYKSSASESHQIKIQLWDYSDSQWENYGFLGIIEDYEVKVLGVFDSEEHISGGIVQLRILSDSTGNPSHEHFFDWIVISKGYGTPAGQEIDPFWNAEKLNYLNSTEILGFNYYNETDFNINDYYLNSNPFGFYNSSDFSISDYVLESALVGLVGNWSEDMVNYYTSSQVDSLPVSTFSNDNGYYNSTTIPSYLQNIVEDTTPQLGGNLDAQSNNVTSVDCIIFSNGGKWCSA